ncbi:MAG TPA: hypothetical protein VFI46_07345 [Jiangellaceae bacterium]|nr:hypothetical protein [Jiangellaceae bacterium]
MDTVVEHRPGDVSYVRAGHAHDEHVGAVPLVSGLCRNVIIVPSGE